MNRMAEIEGGTEDELVQFRNLATGAVALSTRVAAHGLREAREDVMRANDE